MICVSKFLAETGGDVGLAMQLAHDALGPDGGALRIPAENNYYLASTTARFTKPISLVGDGVYSSEILTYTAGLQVIETISKLDIGNVGFISLGEAAGNSGFVHWGAASANHNGSVIANCRFVGASRPIHSLRANALIVRDNSIHATNGVGLCLENLANPDEGDLFITGNTFSSDDKSINVWLKSTSGVFVQSNKFNGLSGGHVLIGAGDNAVLGNYMVCGNSFEGHKDYAIRLNAGNGVCTKSIITGNQFSSNSPLHVQIGAASQNASITANIFNNGSAAEGVGVQVESGSRTTLVSGNAFHQIKTAIQAGGNAIGVSYGGNTFAGDVLEAVRAEDGWTWEPADQQVTMCGVVSNASDVESLDVIEIKGRGVLDVSCYGVVQGVGFSSASARFVLSDGVCNQLGSTVYAGPAFELSVFMSGGFVRVGALRAKNLGTAVSMNITASLSGQCVRMARI